MKKTLIIADDLTGANATAVLFAENGYSTGTFMNLEFYKKSDKEFEATAISTESRALKSSIAYKRVNEVIKYFVKNQNINLYVNRVDSTLRGNIGAEIDGALDALKEDYIAVVVPAFPSSNRICLGSNILVDQKLLHKTEVAKDPKTPVCTSYVPDIIKKQSKYKIGTININTVQKGKDCVLNEIKRLKEENCKIIVIDSTDQEDIKIVAKAVSELSNRYITIDPGPFSQTVYEQMFKNKKKDYKKEKKIFLMVGSVTELTRQQLNVLEENYSSFLLTINPEKLLTDKRNKEINKAVKTINHNIKKRYKVIGIVTSRTKENILNLDKISKKYNMRKDKIAQKIISGLGEATGKILKKNKDKFKGIYVSGGDSTVILSDSIKSYGFIIKKELLPLAVYGKILGGDLNGMPIVTKGGMIGNENAAVECLEYIDSQN